MLIPIPPEWHLAFLQQERMREAESHRLADLARQYAKARRVGVSDSERKESVR